MMIIIIAEIIIANFKDKKRVHSDSFSDEFYKLGLELEKHAWSRDIVLILSIINE